MDNSFASFIQESGLYEEKDITKENYEELYDLIEGEEKFYLYCTKCQRMSVFQQQSIKTTLISQDGTVYQKPLHEILRNAYRHEHMPRLGTGWVEPSWKWNPQIDKNITRVIVLSYMCSMNSDHYVDYILHTEGNKIRKIGQNPSVADISFPQLDDLRNVIDVQSRRELRRAIGLYAQGIGIGAYVYLRRVFERIIDEAKKQAVSGNKINCEEFDSLKMSEKIKTLRDYLPDAVIKNAAIYGIVSKGIHEMSEEDCITYFPVLKDTILLILKQWSAKKNEINAEKDLSKLISKINAELS